MLYRVSSSICLSSPSTDMPPTINITLIGGGGHAVVVAEAARAAGFNHLGVYDDDRHCAAAVPPDAVQWLGPMHDLTEMRSAWILCLGDLSARAAMLKRLSDAPASTVIHPSAFISTSAKIASGVFVAPAAVIHSRANIAAHAIINTGVIIEHDCHIAENCHLAPRTTLGGSVRIGPNTLVGLGAIILPGIQVGSNCIIGAGAVVLADVPDNTRVVGNPARVID